jgi:large subunit ribosomal protein L17
MRHSVFGRKLSRNTDERKRLFTVLIRNLFVHDAIVTTRAKAKTIQPIVEKLITKAKGGSEVNRRWIETLLSDRLLTNRLFDEAKTRFNTRSSGFTRIIKRGKRLGDATDTAVISFVDERAQTEVAVLKKGKEKETKREEAKPKKVTAKKVVKKQTKKA